MIIEQIILFTLAFVMTIAFAYFSFLAWFKYSVFLQKAKGFQNNLDDRGFSKSTYASEILDSQMYKWLARMVFSLLFLFPFSCLILTIYGFVLKLVF